MSYLLLTHTVLLLRLSRMKATNIVVGKKKRLKVFRDLFGILVCLCFSTAQPAGYDQV